MKITHGTAIYTGGGLYMVIGELDNGLWFGGGSDYCDVFDADIQTYDEVNDGLAFYWSEWCEEHRVEVDAKEKYAAFEDFCKRLDAQEPGITDGFEKWSNYIPGEVTEMIDFSYFEERDGYHG